MDTKRSPGRPVSPRAHGPVYDARMALEARDGRRVSRAELAALIGCAERTLVRCELEGVAPQSRAVRDRLESLGGACPDIHLEKELNHD
jgi:hypothetical protein